MSGIYFHIPYCRQACHYCNFHFSTTLKSKEKLLVALEKEIELRKSFLPPNPIETIYFGGGTPSILSRKELQSILQKTHENFQVNKNAEITIEVNPDDLNPDLLKHYHEIGINRLSIGIQSFDNQQLTWMNRSHNARQAESAISMAIQAGFENISIDFIFNLPNQSLTQIESEIKKGMELGAKHISIYGLTVEEKTVLSKRQKNGSFVIDHDQGSDLFEGIMNLMNQNTWLHYEISNYALEERFISRHNSAYWEQVPYLGIGPSAHSFDGELRWFNHANNPGYINKISGGEPAGEWESLEEYQRFNEKILLGLRTSKGISIEEIQNRFAKKYVNHLLQVLDSIKDEQWLEQKNQRLVLTNKGKLLADYITSQFFYPA